ncbi:MAG: hypothetical protein A3G52_01900 [Candidatus Taylorbacteria bacterium RIFCSPLOWO2_12_FULL_43_20]|uniref:dolichyl-phosphate beta-glucosyltransferase n=1 Tax=Candidatus Taylorbacteria bacterium RIFCSPLOWO2_12_FULL_43_20 TaxID=1802332 RepID=A0A1G2P3W6_9BACT|nr:MAG: hypothetical protein A2825_01995 [Candidatus Taylorbacteria bacterium RIFCSPHIGHO2_01_FULL_43_120]OHA23005.1 MAG: hypothetical protein A3B98_01870 [Candidatus Taylorbacteria bacterium RIFCSPHIGHO2_02_FULL_43_55]OHA30121.1 MAG: hypothetical protein A3E92_00905 [Candidatus Taylorbacteria bacterium RIFCSPHIGHO2_12_FULL_42_34]OHA30719.1 MAG: hypothetical protein A3B09_01660 [Candidatus Taylorbacteria bacterium RIFCSPLOWO2_01_FULL_43_83]OHA39592.1 MAG: hypothetical protein A3H58_02345 [Candi
MFLSIIIPCFNEESRINITLSRIAEHFSTFKREYEIIVVNDGSTDNTAKIIDSFKTQIPQIKLIDLGANIGKGGAVKAGMLEARGQYRLFMDADNSTSIDNIKRFLEYAKNGYDIVISSRQMPDSTFVLKQPLNRRILGAVFRTIVAIIIPLRGIKDTQNGFKLFTKSAADSLFSRQSTNGWAFDIEILAMAVKHKYKIKEVGIEWTNDADSKMSLKGMINMLFELIKIRAKMYKRNTPA